MAGRIVLVVALAILCPGASGGVLGALGALGKLGVMGSWGLSGVLGLESTFDSDPYKHDHEHEQDQDHLTKPYSPLPSERNGCPLRVCGPKGAKDEHVCREYVELYEFITREGFFTSDLVIGEFEGLVAGTVRRGLMTLTDKKKGDLLISAPVSAMMCKLSAMESRLAVLFKHIEKSASPRLMMVLHVLYENFEKEKREGVPSRFRSYLATIPTHNPTLLTFTQDEIEQLQCPSDCPALGDVLGDRKAYLREISIVSKVLGPVLAKSGLYEQDSLSKANLSWAYNVVNSRSFSVRSYDALGDTRFIMVPFADLLNHHNSNLASLKGPNYTFNLTAKALQVFADRDYKAGDEVLISYGIRSNPKLLLGYGFALPDNEFESIGLQIELNEEDRKGKLLEFLKRSPNATFARITLDATLNHDFLTVLRLKHGATDIDAVDVDPWVEFRLRLDILRTIERLLNRYPTSLAYDLNLLRQWSTLPSTPTRTAGSLSAVIFRVEIKRILHLSMLQTLHAIRHTYSKAVAAGNLQAKSDPSHWFHWKNDIALWDSEFRQWQSDLRGIWTRPKRC